MWVEFEISKNIIKREMKQGGYATVTQTIRAHFGGNIDLWYRAYAYNYWGRYRRRVAE